MVKEAEQGGSTARRFPATVAVISLIAATSTAICLLLEVPAWGMFVGWIAFATGGSGRSGAVAWGSVILGLVLGMTGSLAIGAVAQLGFIAVPVVVFVITAVAVTAQRAPLLNSVIGYFIGMTAFFASGMSAGLATFGVLALPISLGSLSGYVAGLLAAKLSRAAV